MKNLIKLCVVMFAGALVMIMPACNRENSETNNMKDAEQRNDQKFVKPTETDAKYVVDAYADGMAEIKMAERVKDRLVTTDAKNLANTMITDHTAMNDKMRTLASSKQISLPTDLTSGQQDDIEDLAKKSGTDLDKAFVDKLVSDHKNAEDLFQKASTDATDSDIRSAFEDGLPKIRMHLEMAKDAQDKLNAGK